MYIYFSTICYIFFTAFFPWRFPKSFLVIRLGNVGLHQKFAHLYCINSELDYPASPLYFWPSWFRPLCPFKSVPFHSVSWPFHFSAGAEKYATISSQPSSVRVCVCVCACEGVCVCGPCLPCKLLCVKRFSLAALSVGKFQRLAKTTRAKGTKTENITQKQAKSQGKKVKVKVKGFGYMGGIGKCISYLKSENICFGLLPLRCFHFGPYTHAHTRTKKG